VDSFTGNRPHGNAGCGHVTRETATFVLERSGRAVRAAGARCTIALEFSSGDRPTHKTAVMSKAVVRG
jgi:hypothetical protein